MLRHYFISGSGDSKEPETEREVAKEYLRGYVLLDWRPEDIPKRATSGGWEVQIGGEARDVQGLLHQLRSEQIAITRLRYSPCFAVFTLAEIINEIRREAGKEPTEEDVPRCLYCTAPLDNNPAGRTRLFCDNKGKCKVAYHRKLEREQTRTAILESQTELRSIWEKHT